MGQQSSKGSVCHKFNLGLLSDCICSSGFTGWFTGMWRLPGDWYTPLHQQPYCFSSQGKYNSFQLWDTHCSHSCHCAVWFVHCWHLYCGRFIWLCFAFDCLHLFNSGKERLIIPNCFAATVFFLKCVLQLPTFQQIWSNLSKKKQGSHMHIKCQQCAMVLKHNKCLL